MRLGNNLLLSGELLRGRGKPPRQHVIDVLDRLLWELERETTAGQEIAWDSLRLSVEPEAPFGADCLRFRAEVRVDEDPVVAGLSALAVAARERER